MLTKRTQQCLVAAGLCLSLMPLPMLACPTVDTVEAPQCQHEASTTTKIYFLIPLKDNEGHAFSDSDFDWLEAELIHLAGGFTLQGEVRGVYVGEHGTLYRDTHCAYAVVTQNPETIMGLLKQAAQRFKQESIYMERSQPTVVLIRP